MAELKVIANELGGFQTNCYIVANDETKEAIVIDPSWNAEFIKGKLDSEGLNCVGIYLTHGHIDHMAAMDELKALTGVPTYASEDEKEVLGSSKANLSAMMTTVFGKVVETSADNYLADGDVRKVLGTEMKCISVLDIPEAECVIILRMNISCFQGTHFSSIALEGRISLQVMRALFWRIYVRSSLFSLMRRLSIRDTTELPRLAKRRR